MKIYDPLYGTFELSPLASALSTSPEVRRLSQIRLLNSMTPSLSTLGELRRYAHTLGVLNLFQEWKKIGGKAVSSRELDALEAAIILHDIATPPFGHLFEYLLKEELGWDHESAAEHLLLKNHVAESSGHQIYVGKSPQVVRELEKLKIDLDLVLSILRKEHPLHALIFGSLDFDNIDNVWRMAWSLGIKLNPSDAVELAKALFVEASGDWGIKADAELHVSTWASLRRQVYEVMIFDQPTVASQAILTSSLRLALRSGRISTEHWTLTDEQLLDRLMQDPATKKMIRDEYLGRLPQPLVTLQLPWLESELYEQKRVQIQDGVEEIVNQYLSGRCVAYVFKEKGSFSKELSYRNERGDRKLFGSRSQSLIIYVFCSESSLAGTDKKMPFILDKLGTYLGVSETEMLKVIVKGHDARRGTTLSLDI